MSEDTYAGIWKAAALFLAGVVVTLSGAWFSVTRDSVSRTEIPVMMKEYTDQLISVREQNARMEEKMIQLQVDVARISERLGVPMHPGQENQRR
jgi:hypothetical protein